MTQEQKANAYDDVVNKLRHFILQGVDPLITRADVQDFFPELAESEEEKIRKDIIVLVKDWWDRVNKDNISTKEQMLFWLEKQGYEPNWCHHKVDLSNCSEEYRKAYYDGWNNCNQQHEQCNAEHKLEPKFKVGDWIVFNGLVLHINEIVSGYYITKSIGGITNSYDWDIDNTARLWTIQDAKDGDMLACGDKVADNPFIFHNLTEELNPRSYCGVNTLCHFQDNDENGGFWCNSDEVRPATKEQRDLLFQKMHEDGYTFDFEKKELKKLKFRVGDEVETENEDSLTITRIDEEGYWSNDLFICDFDEECIWDLVEQKSAWSEEDEQYLLICKNALAKYQITDKWDASIISRWLETKLKSLRPQPKQEWKQENREELTEFENAMMHIGGSFFGENAGLDPNDTDTIKEQAELLLELAPKTEWSEEDEKNLRRAIRTTKVVYPVTADWLKSIRNRITLKPSIEQMKILEKVTGVDIEKTLNGFQNFYAHENSGEFPSAIEIAKHFYKLGLKASDTELENLLWTLPESIADERSRQVYLMSLYHCDGQCFVDYVGELEEDSLVCFEGETFMEAATKMREWIRKRPKLRKI